MTWEKYVTRRSEFLKNCLLYLAMERNPIPSSYNQSLTVRRGMEFVHYRDVEDFRNMSRQVMDSVKQDPRFIKKVIESGQRHAAELKKAVKKIPSIDLSKLSNRQLHKLYREYCRAYMQLYRTFHLSEKDEALAEAALEILKDRTKDKAKAHEILTELTTPVRHSATAFEELCFLRLCANVESMIAEHTRKFAYLPTTNEEKPWDEKYFTKKLCQYLRGGNISGKFEEIKAKPGKIRSQKQKLMRELNLPPNIRAYVLALSGFTWNRLYMRNIFCLAHHYAGGMFREIAKRAGVREQLVRFMTPEETAELLLRQQPMSLKTIAERKKFCVLYLTNKRFKLYTGTEAQNILDKEIPEESFNSKAHEVMGAAASPGSAKGPCKIVLGPKDQAKIREGDIIVTAMTTPDLVPVLHKVAAIVTDEGGLTCHAAVIARELAKPCVTGTKIGTKIFKDGDILEVDAHKGVVRRIK